VPHKQSKSQDNASKNPEDRGGKFAEDDLGMAYTLLGGYEVTHDGNLPETVYLDEHHDPARDSEARMAIVRLLRAPGPLDRQLRDMLAGLFDPQPDTYPGGERRITFKHRKNSIGRRVRARTVVANEIYKLHHQEGMSVEEACAQVAEKYKSRQRTRKGIPWGEVGESMSAESAMKCWGRLKRLVEWSEEQRKEFEHLQSLRQKTRAQEQGSNDLRARIKELEEIKRSSKQGGRPSQ
jgi:hypothetical protein